MDSTTARKNINTDSLVRRNELKLYSYDNTYQNLLGSSQWLKLKPEIRKRFSVKPLMHSSIRYVGMMDVVKFNFMGWMFAQVCRLIGTPLAPYEGENIPMDIELVIHESTGGVSWNRTYKFNSGKITTVRSIKCLYSAGQLEEHIGFGFSMKLEVFERNGDLFFVSKDYLLRIGSLEVHLPRFITPGITTVSHEQISGARFRFTLSVVHPVFGETIYQIGEFRSVS